MNRRIGYCNSYLRHLACIFFVNATFHFANFHAQMAHFAKWPWDTWWDTSGSLWCDIQISCLTSIQDTITLTTVAQCEIITCNADFIVSTLQKRFVQLRQSRCLLNTARTPRTHNQRFPVAQNLLVPVTGWVWQNIVSRQVIISNHGKHRNVWKS